MKALGKGAFFLGLVVAGVAAFVASSWLPWVVGGLGLLVGALHATPPADERAVLLAGIGVVVALSAIHLQFFNPEWLGRIVFFERVFVAHVLLAVGFVLLYRAVTSAR